jgi:hypothetical protein
VQVQPIEGGQEELKDGRALMTGPSGVKVRLTVGDERGGGLIDLPRKEHRSIQR